MRNTSDLPGWLAEALESLTAGDVDKWTSVFSADGVWEFPWAPENGVEHLEGHEEIAACLRQILDGGTIRFGSFGDVRVHEAEDELIVEATGHHHRGSDGSPIELGYVWFITLRDGQVINFRDYINPVQLALL